MNLSGVATETIINSLRGVKNFGVCFFFSVGSMWGGKKYVFRDFDRYVNFRDWKVSFGAIFNASCVLTSKFFVNSINAMQSKWMDVVRIQWIQHKANQSKQRSKQVSTRASAIIFISLQIVFCFSVSVDFCYFFYVFCFFFCYFCVALYFHLLIQLENEVQPLLI